MHHKYLGKYNFITCFMEKALQMHCNKLSWEIASKTLDKAINILNFDAIHR